MLLSNASEAYGAFRLASSCTLCCIKGCNEPQFLTFGSCCIVLLLEGWLVILKLGIELLGLLREIGDGVAHDAVGNKTLKIYIFPLNWEASFP